MNARDTILNEVIQNTEQPRYLHLRFDGRSRDVPLAQLDVGAASTDEQIKHALAANLNVPVQKFDDYAVDRAPDGSLTVRPEAVFG